MSWLSTISFILFYNVYLNEMNHTFSFSRIIKFIRILFIVYFQYLFTYATIATFQ